ncbi:hypothetical protein DFJ73DRAFT_915414 [Zopfochytrium polystomum]|nr:hypothetical protein DFJ73DRAFT_915414 [Zopfochytrium polystomum]
MAATAATTAGSATSFAPPFAPLFDDVDAVAAALVGFAAEVVVAAGAEVVDAAALLDEDPPQPPPPPPPWRITSLQTSSPATAPLFDDVDAVAFVVPALDPDDDDADPVAAAFDVVIPDVIPDDDGISDPEAVLVDGAVVTQRCGPIDNDDARPHAHLAVIWFCADKVERAGGRESVVVLVGGGVAQVKLAGEVGERGARGVVGGGDGVMFAAEIELELGGWDVRGEYKLALKRRYSVRVEGVFFLDVAAANNHLRLAQRLIALDESPSLSILILLHLFSKGCRSSSKYSDCQKNGS